MWRSPLEPQYLMDEAMVDKLIIIVSDRPHLSPYGQRHASPGKKEQKKSLENIILIKQNKFENHLIKLL